MTDQSREAGGSPISGVSINDIVMEMPSRTPEHPTPNVVEDTTDLPQPECPQALLTVCPTRTEGQTNEEPRLPDSGEEMYVARRVAVEEELLEVGGAVEDSGVEDVLGGLLSSLDDYRGQFPELQLLEQELRLLQVTLKVRGAKGVTLKKRVLRWGGRS